MDGSDDLLITLWPLLQRVRRPTCRAINQDPRPVHVLTQFLNKFQVDTVLERLLKAHEVHILRPVVSVSRCGIHNLFGAVLFLCSWAGHLQCLNLLMEWGGRRRFFWPPSSWSDVLMLGTTIGNQLDCLQRVCEVWHVHPGYAMDSDGTTALMYAAYCGHAELVHWLLLQKCPHATKNESNWSALQICCLKDHLACFKPLFYASQADATDEWMRTEAWAASYGAITILQFLHEILPYPNRYQTGPSALQTAIKKRHIPVIVWLLDVVQVSVTVLFVQVAIAHATDKQPNLDILELLFCRSPLTFAISATTILHNCPPLLSVCQWLLHHGTVFDTAFLKVVVQGAHVDVLPWVLSLPCMSLMTLHADGIVNHNKQRLYMGSIWHFLVANCHSYTTYNIFRLLVSAGLPFDLHQRDSNGMPARVHASRNTIDEVLLPFPSSNWHWMLCWPDIAIIRKGLLIGGDPNSLLTIDMQKCILRVRQMCYPGTPAPELMPDVITLLHRARLPWVPARHCLFGPQFRARVLFCLCMRQYLMPILPVELWFRIMFYLPRDLDKAFNAINHCVE